MEPLLDSILANIKPPQGEVDAPLQLLFSSLDYDDYIGRIGVGKISRGRVKEGEAVTLCRQDGTTANVKVVKLYHFEGLKRVECDSAYMGDIVAVSGIADLNIGETACTLDAPDPLPFVKIDEPTITMNFMVNDSPFAGQDGKFVTSRNIRARLYKEVETNVSMRVEDTDTTDAFKVSGRGELHLSILIETMRREGFELACSNPRVLYKEIDGVKQEPMERVTLDVPNDMVGVVVEKLGQRKGDLVSMNPLGSRTRVEYVIPARCLFGYRSEFLTATHGEGVMNSIFDGYAPYRGEIQMRFTGSLIASTAGETTRYGLYKTQERGQLFVGPQTAVYEGMIVGENPKNDDIAVNPCQKKQLTAIRSAGADEKLLLTPPKIFSLEEAIEFITDDDLIEVTPKSIRLRKKTLNTELRMKEMMRRRRELEAQRK
jgi:GTP-binding protein